MLRIERLREGIRALSAHAAEAHTRRRRDADEALRWLREAPPAAALITEIEASLDTLGTWSGAVPCGAIPIDARLPATPLSLDGTIVIAADGSQIYPDRHASALYYLIQLGGIVFRYNGQAPTCYSRESLHFEEHELYTENGLLVSSEAIGAQRMVEEMAFLGDIAAEERRARPEAPIFTLSDGPLGWTYLMRSESEQRNVQTYLAALDRLRASNANPVGYVDRPGSSALIELLWFSRLASAHRGEQLDQNPLALLTDQALMAQHLAPGERSPWFRRLGPAQQRHRAAGHEIWFCYLNIGRAEQPIIARIEAPAWTAQDEATVTMLHNVLLHQGRALDGYPYALARAHEEALVTVEDRAALDALIQRHLLALGVMAQPSEKARQKAYLGQR